MLYAELLATAIVPLYNGETAPKALRGALIVLYQVNIFSGYVLVLHAHCNVNVTLTPRQPGSS